MKKWLKQANWLVIAGVVTGIYAAALLWQLGWADMLSFLSPETPFNEIGDFLAGVFAPVALIWLVAAVFTQRQELNETRDQFEENRKVVGAQLKTINSQNALLALQHNQAQDSAKQTYKLSLFDKRFSIYKDLIQLKSKMESARRISSEWQELERIAERSAFVFGSEVTDYLERVVAECVELITFEDSNADAWNTLNGRSPTDSENVRVRNQYQTGKMAIEEAISMASLKQLMWSSMHVSDN